MENFESTTPHDQDTELSESPVLTPEQVVEYTEFFRKNFEPSVRFARSRGASDPEAAAQTAMMNAMRHWGNYEDRGSTREAWLSVMVRNQVINEQRRYSRIAIDPSSDEFVYENSIDPRAELEYVDVATNDTVRDAFDQIADVLTDQEIQDNWLEIFKLYALGDKTQNEIAQELGVNPGTVRSRLHRLKLRLADKAALHDTLSYDPIDA